MGDDRYRRYSEGAPTSSAPHARASDADAPSEEAFVPAGEPEAPTPPLAEESSDASAPEVDHEAKLEHDLEELTAKAQKADEYLELAQRTKADFENYRKRAAREAAAAQERGVIKLARELLPAVDNLDRALAAAGASSNGGELSSGVKLVQDELIAALSRAGSSCSRLRASGSIRSVTRPLLSSPSRARSPGRSSRSISRAVGWVIS